MLRGKFVLPLFFSLFFLTAASSQMFNFSATSYKALWRWYFFTATQNVLSLVELDMPIDWLSIIVVFEIQAIVVARIMSVLNFFASSSGSPWCTHSENFLWTEFSQKKSLLSSSFQVSSEISNSRVEFSETLENRIFCDSSDSHKYRSVNLSLTSTLYHWSQNLLFLLFLSLATDSRLRAFLAFRLKKKITNEKLFETEDSNTVETPNRPGFSIMFFEKSEKLWFGSLMSVVSSSTEVFLSNSLVWVICVCIWLGQVAKLLDASAELRVSIASRTGRVRQESGQERDVEVSVQENCKDGWDTREKARWRQTTDVQIPFTDTWAVRTCDTNDNVWSAQCERAVRRTMYVQQRVCTLLTRVSSLDFCCP